MIGLDATVRGIPGAGPLAAAVRAAGSPAHLRLLVSLAAAGRVALVDLDAARTDRWAAASATLRQEVRAFAQAPHPGLDVVTPAVLDLHVPDIHAQAKAAAASSWFGRRKRLRAVLERLSPALRPGVQVPPGEVLELAAALDQVHAAAMSLTGRVGALPGVRLAAGWNPLTDKAAQALDQQLDWLGWAGRALTPGTSGTDAARAWVSSGSADEGLQALTSAWGAVQDATGALDADVERWAVPLGLVGRWESTARGRGLADPQLLDLRRWVALVQELEPLREACLDEARVQLLTGHVRADDAVRALDRGLASASMAERRQETGLESFDALSHGRTISRFTTSAEAVRELMASELPRQVVRSRPFQVESARGRVGALQRELGRQRGGLGVRGLLQQYGDLITQVMPCVLVSPDSLSRFFPTETTPFDLVVFDEASQIRVADAVGAMGRARSVVVVGDSKQMPPTSFAESTVDTLDDPDEEPALDESVIAVEDEESILTECVQARVPRHWLSWHYRSQDESLIAFSNRHYYEGKLSSFPAPRTGASVPGADGHGISLVRVAGEFQRRGKGKLLRTNPVEAEAVVTEIRRRFEASPARAPSIGVVTFNQQQRAHIEALLRDAGDERLAEALDDPDGLFVKNLENVQGDERDTVLFSTSFSVNDAGVLPLNFGPLNQVGGERRLNVAVTRARRQVVVFSSFDPSQLRAEETASVGVKHLRAYLDLAAGAASPQGPRISRTAVVDRHRDEVAARLRSRGLVVCTDVGLSEFRIDLTLASAVRPDQPLVAVLLDGPGWARRRTVGDRDGLPQEVLSRMMGWSAVERVWLPVWLADPEPAVDRLVAMVHDLASGRVAVADVERRPVVLSKKAAVSFVKGLPPAAPAHRAVLVHEETFVRWAPADRGSR